MTYVIAEPCIDVKDKACVEECPVDCIYEGDRMLYIHPTECIDCGACEPECPWQAIFEESGVPEVFSEDTPLNYAMMKNTGDFEVCKHEQKPRPTADEIAANKSKWQYSG